jgi:alkanesulfonate monooxygenase SsuD/methylene tetrahydromethanopterin reductase-like flavin-dependent oxidoreductase (luciferase family)
VRASASATGRTPRLCYSTVIVTDERSLAAVRPVMFWRLADAPPELRAQLGVTSADIEAMRQVVATEGMPAVGRLIKDEWVRPFVIMGTPAECAAELGGLLARLEIDEFMLPLLDVEAAPELMATVAGIIAHAQ